VVEGALGEGLSSGVAPQVGGEAETLHDGQIGQQSHLGGSWPLLLAEDVSAPLGQDTVHVAHGVLGDTDVAQVHGLKESGLAGHQGGEANAPSGGHDLSHTTVDGIGVKHDVHEVEPAAAHDLLAQRAVLGSPGESSDDTLLDLEQVVDSLGGVDEHVGAGSIGAEGPDLPRLRTKHELELELCVCVCVCVCVG